jgi:uncharacterized beta-barrel protein YwiB (DUF1934 family)
MGATMPKTDISFSIQNDESSKSLKTQGIFKDNTLKFLDDEHVKHTVIIQEKRIQYKKDGLVKMDFVFEKDTVHVGKYQVKHGTFQFEIYTHKLLVSKSRIDVHYTLKQDGEFVNRGHLNVEYETI